MVTLSGQAIPAVMRGAALYLAIVQFLFATSWTIYVIYLPQLAQSVGIPKELVIGILLLDQLTFAITDFALGKLDADGAPDLLYAYQDGWSTTSGVYYYTTYYGGGWTSFIVTAIAGGNAIST